MSLLVTLNGANYIIPETNEVGWGSNLDAYFVAIAAGCLQKTGGLFTLSAETDFGSSFGLKSLYYKSRASNVASTGAFRLANAETGIVWRNFLNNADLPLTVNASNQLTFNGVAIAGSGTFTASRAVITDGSGNLTSATTTSTEIGYVNGVTSAIQTQLDSKADDNLVVHLAGTENITGAKTFTTVIASSATGSIFSNNISSSSDSTFQMQNTGTGGVNLRLFHGNNDTSDTWMEFLAGASISDTWSIGVDNSDSHKFKISNSTTLGTNDALTFDLNQAVANDLTFASGKVIKLTDNSTNTVSLKATNSTTSYTLSFPNTAGTNGFFLQTDGSGNTTWASGGSGTVSSGTAGRFSLYPTSTNTVSDTYVQNTHNITLAIATQAARSADLAIIIPNPGNAVTTANLLLDSDTNAYTIAGTWTFSANPTILIPNGGGAAKLIIQSGATTSGTSELELIYKDSGGTSQTWRTGGAINFTDGSYEIADITAGVLTKLRILRGSTGGVAIQGTGTNDSATAGFVGETISSAVGATNLSSGSYTDLTSINLTAGDWLVSGVWQFFRNGATITSIEVGISTTAGNSTTGLSYGDNRIGTDNFTFNTGSNAMPFSIPSWRLSLSGSATVYLKYTTSFSVATAQAAGRISAVRIR